MATRSSSKRWCERWSKTAPWRAGPGHYELTRPLAHIRVPPTIQATLAARIDRLSAEHKAVLQAAAVIGRDFPVPVLAGVTDVTDDVLEDAMRALCGAELLQETAGGPVGRIPVLASPDPGGRLRLAAGGTTGAAAHGGGRDAREG